MPLLLKRHLEDAYVPSGPPDSGTLYVVFAFFRPSRILTTPGSFMTSLRTVSRQSPSFMLSFDLDFGPKEGRKVQPGSSTSFSPLWKDADPDVPILKQAKAEFASLQ